MTRNVVIINTVTKKRVKELSLLHGETEGRIVAMAVYLLEQLPPCPDMVERVYVTQSVQTDYVKAGEM